MMYNNKLAIAVKSNGKVLRELKDTVFIPFGTEYSLLLKNLDSVRAQVRVTVDGTDATEGVNLIVPANGELELERFIKNANMDGGNKFKFIERTAGIEQHRGVGVTDGLIRVEFQFEKRVPKTVVHHFYHDYFRSDPYWYNRSMLYGSINSAIGSAGNSDFERSLADYECKSKSAPQSSILRGMDSIQCYSANASNTSFATQSLTSTATYDSAPVNDVGITVAGSKSEQQFKLGASFFVEDEVHVMVLKMLGETPSGKQVRQAVTVKSKPKCTTCGRTNKATAKFCVECGTSLEIV